jgi:putative membrane protein
MKIGHNGLFSGAEKERIRQAVQEAEKTTSGEIVVVVVEESDPYREAQLMGGIFFGALCAMVLALVLRHVTIWFYIPVAILLFFPGFYLFRRFPDLKLAFLGHKRVEQAVRERAVYGFFQKGVHKTEQETGVLIFISLLERKVWILADKGINEKIESHFWRSLARELVDGIKGRQPLDALCSVIQKCGEELGRHFPEKGGGKNQLCDEPTC